MKSIYADLLIPPPEYELHFFLVSKALLLVHRDVTNLSISDHHLIDDQIVEVDWEGNILWEWNPHEHFDELGFDSRAKDVLRRNPNLVPLDASRFYSPFISSAQRLPNGNTLITEGSDGRVFEVTEQHEIVWEYISPYRGKLPFALNMVYRAYRYPYDWVPQLDKPDETAIARLDPANFRVPGAAEPGRLHETVFAGAQQYDLDPDFCVFPERSGG